MQGDQGPGQVQPCRQQSDQSGLSSVQQVEQVWRAECKLCYGTINNVMGPSAYGTPLMAPLSTQARPACLGLERSSTTDCKS